MYTISRKSTGEVCGRDVPADSLGLVLACYPSGVYAVEDSDGRELQLAIVKAGRVEVDRELS